MSQPRSCPSKCMRHVQNYFLSLVQTSVRAEMEMNRGVVYDLEVSVRYYFYGPHRHYVDQTILVVHFRNVAPIEYRHYRLDQTRDFRKLIE